MKSKIEPKKTEQPNQSINYMLRQKYIQLGPMRYVIFYFKKKMKKKLDVFGY